MMGKRISSHTRKELLEAMRRRYRESSKMDKTKILDEFVALTDYHRKHGIRLLNQPCDIDAWLFRVSKAACIVAPIISKA